MDRPGQNLLHVGKITRSDERVSCTGPRRGAHLTDSHVWDASTVASLDAITTTYDRKGKAVEIVGLNAASAERHERLTGSLPSH